MEEQRIIHVGQRYKVQFEQAAVKGQLGYKVEANGDNLDMVIMEARTLQHQAAEVAPPLETKVNEVK